MAEPGRVLAFRPAGPPKPLADRRALLLMLLWAEREAALLDSPAAAEKLREAAERLRETL